MTGVGSRYRPRRDWKPVAASVTRPRMSLVLQPFLPFPHGCQGPSPHQQGRDARMIEQCFGSLDALVGKKPQARGNFEPERPSSAAVDYELELGGLLDRQIGRLGTLEYLVDISGEAAINVRGAGVTAQSSLCPALSTAGRSNTAPPAVQSKAANAKHSAAMTRDRNHSRCAGVMPHGSMKTPAGWSRMACAAERVGAADV